MAHEAHVAHVARTLMRSSSVLGITSASVAARDFMAVSRSTLRPECCEVDRCG